MVMDAQALEQWKSRVFSYQQQVRENKPPQQVILFNVTPSDCESDIIDPFKLQLQSMAFYQMADDYGQAAVYFVIDFAAELKCQCIHEEILVRYQKGYITDIVMVSSLSCRFLLLSRFHLLFVFHSSQSFQRDLLSFR
jgi:hypothetical protein